MLLPGIQTNFPDPILQKFGCYFFCLCRWAELINPEVELTIYAVKLAFDLAKERNFVDAEATVLLPHSLLNMLIQENKFTRTAKSDDAPDVLKQYIVCLKKPGHTHFVLNDNGVIWDPLDPKRIAAKDYKTDSYRVLV